VLTPDRAGETLQIELKGNLAAMLGATVQTKRSPESDDLSLQVSLVAGARNPLNWEFSWTAASAHGKARADAQSTARRPGRAELRCKKGRVLLSNPQQSSKRRIQSRSDAIGSTPAARYAGP
jgi:hypothetical protein